MKTDTGAPERHMAGTFYSHEAADCPGGPPCSDPAAYRKAPTAIVEEAAQVGGGTRIWHFSVIRAGAIIGKDCNIGSHVVIGPDVVIGDRCKIQDGAKVYGPCAIRDEVFIGPGAVVCNDRYPRAVTDWRPGSDGTVVIERGASIGANAIIVPDCRIGERVMIPAGACERRALVLRIERQVG